MSTANMGLTLPIVSQTLGPTWASQINGDLSLIDEHNHTAGSGVAVPVAGLNINADLSFLTASGNFSITDLVSATFYNQAALASERALYTISDNLYYNTTGGTPVQITNGTNVNAGAGSITGMTGTTASVAFNSGTGFFKFEQSTNLPATIDAGTVLVRPQTVGATSGISITAQAGTSSYNLTLPSGLPPGQVLMSLAPNGDIIKLAIDGSTLVLATGTLMRVGVIGSANIGAGQVGTTQIANLSVTSEKLANAITSSAGGASTYTISGNGSFQSVFPFPATISIATLRPLMIVAQGEASASLGSFIEASTTNAEIQILAYQNVTQITKNKVEIVAGVKCPPGALTCVFAPPSTGLWTINAQVKQTSGSSTVFKNVTLQIYQI